MQRIIQKKSTISGSECRRFWMSMYILCFKLPIQIIDNRTVRLVVYFFNGNITGTSAHAFQIIDNGRMVIKISRFEIVYIPQRSRVRHRCLQWLSANLQFLPTDGMILLAGLSSIARFQNRPGRRPICYRLPSLLKALPDSGQTRDQWLPDSVYPNLTLFWWAPGPL